MAKLKSIEELNKLREELAKGVAARHQAATRIIVGMGTCGIAAGAREVMQEILKEIQARQIEANVETTSCIGMCANEPLVDIVGPDQVRVSYGNIKPAMVSRLVEEHLVQGRVVKEWVVSKMGTEGIV